jgi:L-fucose isomerase-like protein
LKILSLFLLGDGQSFIGEDKAEQETKSANILIELGLDKKSKLLVRKEEEILGVNIHGVDVFVIFPYCSERFSSLIYLADTRKPAIIFSEEETFCNALDTYEYLSDHENVQIAFNPEELKRKLRVLDASRWLEKTKVCLFDAGEWKLNGIAYLRNPATLNRLNMRNIDKAKFLETYKNADRTEARNLAKRWMSSAVKVLEPSLEDVVKTARVYLAMKAVMKTMKADAAYVLWCGQFTKKLGTKMCFALAKLADDGIPVGCWRGENLLPLLMLHSISKKPVLPCEAHTRREGIISVRHCFAPTALASGKYVLRRWRDMEDTVTGYCQLPKGEVTLVNCGIGDKLVVAKGNVQDCRDLEGENCRMTVWVKLDDAEVIHKFVGREFAMVYGDYADEVREFGMKLGLKVL